MKFFPALALALLSAAASAEIPQVTLDQIRTSWVDRCASRYIISGSNAERSYRFCGCAFPVIANSMTLSEFAEMDEMKDAARRTALPQLQRVVSQIDHCPRP